MKRIAIIGAGTMGNGIAHVFAQFNYKVALIDISENSLGRAIGTITKNLDRQITKEIITETQKNNTLNNLTTFTEIEKGVQNTELVIEATTENTDLKSKLFSELDKFTNPNTILATNTSSISITQIAANTNRADKVIGMHFMNPVPMMKLVEIIKGYSTSEQTTNTIMEIAKTLEKIPVEVNDYPGFVANRILMPMLNEAIETLYNGVAGVTEIDSVMKLGMAHPMGPLQLADFIGLDICLSILEVMHHGFRNPKYAPNPLLVNMVRAGKLGVKSGEGFYDYTENKKAEKVAKQFQK